MSQKIFRPNDYVQYVYLKMQFLQQYNLDIVENILESGKLFIICDLDKHEQEVARIIFGLIYILLKRLNCNLILIVGYV